MTTAQDRWASFNLAIALYAINPTPLGGIWLRARVGPVRDRIIEALNTALDTDFFLRLHPNISDEALFGGLDLSATLATGRPIQTEGLLNKGGTVILTMAERAESALLVRLAGALDAETGLSIIALD